MLDIPKAEFYRLWYQDLNKIIDGHYGKEVDILDGLDYSQFKNDIFLVWGTDEDWSEDPAAEVFDWLEGGEVPHPQSFLRCLEIAGVIPEGKYLVEIMW